MYQRNVFAENDKSSFAIAARNSTLRINQKTAVIKIYVFDRLRARPRLHIVGADNHPHVMFAREASDGFVSFFVVAQLFGDSSLRPEQQINFVCERLLGKMQQIPE